MIYPVKPVFNNTPTSEKTINAPPPLAPFSIKPKVAVDKQVVKNKISIVDYYSSNSNESNSNSQIVAAQPMQPVPIKPTETKLIKSIKISNDKIITKTDDLEEVNEANKTSELNTEISKEKHKKKKKNKEKEKEKKHHHHGDRKEKAGSLDSTEHVASSPSSTASSTKKRDKKEKKELKKQKKLERANMLNSDKTPSEKTVPISPVKTEQTNKVEDKESKTLNQRLNMRKITRSFIENQ